MQQVNTATKHEGFIALITSITISMVLLTFVVAVGFSGSYGTKNVFGSETNERSTALAEACVSTVALKASQNVYFRGGETITIGDASCYICPVGNTSASEENQETSCEDNLVEGEDYVFDLPTEGILRITYLGSDAGLVSGFFYEVVGSSDAPIEVFPSNDNIDQNTTIDTIFEVGTRFNFFIRTYASAWGYEDYDHYAVGHYASDGITPYALVTELGVNHWRFEFEDLDEEYFSNIDWDYNDEIVEIEIIEPEGGSSDGGNTSGSSTEDTSCLPSTSSNPIDENTQIHIQAQSANAFTNFEITVNPSTGDILTLKEVPTIDTQGGTCIIP